MTIRDLPPMLNPRQLLGLDALNPLQPGGLLDANTSANPLGALDCFGGPSSGVTKRAAPPLPAAQGTFDYGAGEGVTQAQTLLNRFGAGLDQDGIRGPKTQQALRDFQRAAGLPETGALDAQTLRALEQTDPSALKV